jgi:hypothetical protein
VGVVDLSTIIIHKVALLSSCPIVPQRVEHRLRQRLLARLLENAATTTQYV